MCTAGFLHSCFIWGKRKDQYYNYINLYVSFPHFLFPGLQIPIVRNLLRKSQIFDHHHSHCFTALLSDEGVQKTNKTKTKKNPPTAFITVSSILLFMEAVFFHQEELKSLFFIPSRRRSPGDQAGCYTGIPECCHFLSLCFIHGSNKSQTAGGGGVRRAFICGSWTASADFIFFFLSQSCESICAWHNSMCAKILKGLNCCITTSVLKADSMSRVGITI